MYFVKFYYRASGGMKLFNNLSYLSEESARHQYTIWTTSDYDYDTLCGVRIENNSGIVFEQFKNEDNTWPRVVSWEEAIAPKASIRERSVIEI